MAKTSHESGHFRDHSVRKRGSQSQAEKFAESVQIEGQPGRPWNHDPHRRSFRQSSGVPRRPQKFLLRDYDIAVPSDAKLWVRNAFGNVEIRCARAWNDVENSHGQLTLRDVMVAGKLTNSFVRLRPRAWPAT